uniref:Protein TIC 40, chloroplastic n=1 Tax=Lygus hesperus TaxID=30085 RepID=A0A0A9ZE50_LYGHE
MSQTVFLPVKPPFGRGILLCNLFFDQAQQKIKTYHRHLREVFKFVLKTPQFRNELLQRITSGSVSIKWMNTVCCQWFKFKNICHKVGTISSISSQGTFRIKLKH